jgi:AcrR family transcriptional regulator
MILDAAIDYFAENGFSARVREIADSIHVSQSLIFRYFGSKEELIERVYERTFLSRWNPEWETILHDRSRSLRERLNTFYQSYITAVDDRRWIRIAMYASLAGRDLTRRYIQGPVTRLISTIGDELRSDKQFVDLNRELVSELVWHLHSTIIYYLIRKHIHGSAVARDRTRIIGVIIDNFLGPDQQAGRVNKAGLNGLREKRVSTGR